MISVPMPMYMPRPPSGPFPCGLGRSTYPGWFGANGPQARVGGPSRVSQNASWSCSRPLADQRRVAVRDAARDRREQDPFQERLAVVARDRGVAALAREPLPVG